MEYIGIFDVVTQMFVMAMPIEDIEKHKKFLDKKEYILFKLEQYEWKVRKEI